MDLDGEFVGESLVRCDGREEGVAHLTTLIPHEVAVHGVLIQPQGIVGVNLSQVVLGKREGGGDKLGC